MRRMYKDAYPRLIVVGLLAIVILGLFLFVSYWIAHFIFNVVVFAVHRSVK